MTSKPIYQAYLISVVLHVGWQARNKTELIN